MKCNVGWVERTVRFLLGLPIVVGYFYVRHFSAVFSYFLLLSGTMLLLTATAGWCPVHKLMQVLTAKRLAPEETHAS